MRTDIRLEVVCSICGKLLEADENKSKTKCDSADNFCMRMFIKPCKECYGKATEPIKFLKKALEMAE